MEISVIIPVYNVEKYINRCIQSILSQTFQDFEIVIVNDGSTDKSMAIIEKYSQIDSRFLIVNNEQNMGLMWTRMVGYKKAKGKYFVFCDSDDYMPNNSLEILYRAITKSNATIVIGSAQYVSDREKKGVRRDKLSYGTDTDAVYKSLLMGELSHCVWGKIYNRTLFDDYEYQSFSNQTNGEDAILFYQLINNIKKAIIINDIIYYYYINTESATRSTITDKKLKEIIFASDYVSNFIKTNKPQISVYLNKREIKIILALLNSGQVNKKKIKYYSNALDVDYLSSYKSISSNFNGLYKLLVYGLINSRLLRLFRHYYINIKNYF